MGKAGKISGKSSKDVKFAIEKAREMMISGSYLSTGVVAETAATEIDKAEKNATVKSVTDKAKTSSKATQLLLYRTYKTYQVLLEAYPQNELTVDQCFSKIILYVMKWFRERIGEDNVDKLPQLGFLKRDYPEVEQYEEFDIKAVDDIDYLDAADVRTAYSEDSDSWHFTLTEPDNGNDKMDISGRSFTTNVCVYRKSGTVVLGVQISCKDPSNGSEDANVYRPAFIRSIFLNKGNKIRTDIENNIRDIVFTEADVPVEYAFAGDPVVVNGKAGQECTDLVEKLVCNQDRQLPILFVPGEYYNSHKADIDARTVSYLGFCHVVVWDKTPNKLFGQIMGSDELRDVAEEGCLILYRSNPAIGYEVDCAYLDPEEDDMEEDMDEMIKKNDPLRRVYSFEKYPLIADKWSPEKILSILTDKISGDSDTSKQLKSEIERLKAQIDDQLRDNELLQRRINESERNARNSEKECRAAYSEMTKQARLNEKIESSLEVAKSELSEVKRKNDELVKKLAGAASKAKDMYRPLLNLPKLENSDEAKEDILAWIKEYYSDVLIVHEDAVKSFKKDERNIDWKMLCMMLHYIAGYTINRNAGSGVMDNESIRDYDPENYAFKVNPVSTGSSGSAVIYKGSYTIDISAYDKDEKDVVLDLHVAKGKGRGDDMIRIYLYYDANIKKSIIGYMPDHLPTRNNPH